MQAPQKTEGRKEGIKKVLAHKKGLPASGMVAKLGAGAEMKGIFGLPGTP